MIIGRPFLFSIACDFPFRWWFGHRLVYSVAPAVQCLFEEVKPVVEHPLLQSLPFNGGSYDNTVFFSSHFYFPASGQAMVTGVVPSLPRFMPSIFIAHRVQQSQCSSIFHRVLLTHALALSASQFVPKKKSSRFFTSMHSGGLELTKLTYTRLEDNLIRHRGDR